MIPHTITIACIGSPHVLAMELAWGVSKKCVPPLPPSSLKGTAQCNGLKPMHVTEKPTTCFQVFRHTSKIVKSEY